MEQLRRGVRREVEAVEAGVGSGQRLHAAPALDAEPPGACRPAQRSETFVRDRRCAGYELNQPEPLFVCEPAIQ